MSRILWLGVLTLALSVLSGCVPMGGHYYRPSATTGTIVRPYCHEKIGPEDVIRFNYPGSFLEISADSLDSSTVYINVLTSPSTLEVDANAISVYDLDDQKQLTKSNIKTSEYRGESTYNFDVDAAPKKFSVRVPSVEVDRKPYGDVEVIFTREFEMWMEVINC